MTDRRLKHPGLAVVLWFGGFIAAGTVLLLLPVSQQAGGSTVTFSDAFFTSASAITVTGLVVTNTATTWSVFGQVVIACLIQIGGLGIMTVAGFFGIALNRKLGIRSGLLAGTEIGLTELGVLRTLIRDIIRFVLVSELITAVFLSVYFAAVKQMGLGAALRHGTFHAISAFNNAGFSTFETGLEGYVGDWFVNVVIVGSFVLGGLGFPVVFELRSRWRTPHVWSLHTKVTLWVSGLLMVGGAVVFGAIEWTNPSTLGALPVDEKFLASFFQSATARTAGFNTVAFGALRPASLLLIIPLMVVGASSASTGGGIKTSTFAVVMRSTVAELRRDPTTVIFDRKIPVHIQRQALALIVAALGFVGMSTFLLSAVHPDLSTMELLFESASAFGTAGVSTGLTDQVDEVGRAILVVTMFVGRVGPITFGTAVLLRPQRKNYGYPQEDLLVG